MVGATSARIRISQMNLASIQPCAGETGPESGTNDGSIACMQRVITTAPLAHGDRVRIPLHP
jgi:hypothetical protein